jgi:hypothetical protein
MPKYQKGKITLLCSLKEALAWLFTRDTAIVRTFINATMYPT